jgi:hypothetical protein
LLKDAEEGFYETDFLRFYGSLSPEQRQHLSSGRPLRFAEFTPPETESLNKMVFGTHSNLQLIRREGQKPEDFGAFYEGIKREPTELFGSGFPSSSKLNVSGASTNVARASAYETSNGLAVSGNTMAAWEIAERLFAKERPGVMRAIEKEPAIETMRFRHGTRRSLQFDFDFGDIARISLGLQDEDFGDSKPAPFEQMPEAFRKEVQTKLEQLRKRYSNARPGGAGGKTRQSPPPRL